MKTLNTDNAEILARLGQLRPDSQRQWGKMTPHQMLKLVQAIKRFAAPQRDFSFHPHPIFGAMSEEEWMIWGYKHCDHHLRQFGL